MNRHFLQKASILLLISLVFTGLGSAGAASLFDQQMPGSPAAEITFGTTTSDTVSTAGESNSFTFSAESKDVILIGISQVSGNLWPRIRLYDPDGQLIADEESPVHAEIYHVIQPSFKQYIPFMTDNGINNPTSLAAPSSVQSPVVTTPGQYTIVVSDGFNGTYTGTYSLFLQKLNPPVGATGITFGQTLTGAVNYAAEMDAFTIDAVNGERILVGVTNVSGDIWPEIRLYDPAGLPLLKNDGPIHSEIEFNITMSGPYTILIADGFRGTYTGSFNLFIQRLNDPANATSMSFGDTKQGAISLAAEMDAYTFDALANDQVQITVAHVAGDIWPQIRLYDPAGLLLNEQSGPASSEITQVLTASGRYTILVSDGFRGAYTGSYNLHLNVLP